MSKDQQRMRKQKERERLKRAKILGRREAIRKVAKQDREDARLEKRLKSIERGLDRFEDHHSIEDLRKLPEATLTQLEQNIKILQALEDEWQKEQDQRQQLNDELESEGYHTLEEKLRHSHDKLVQERDNSFGVCGSADCSMIPNSESAVCTVIPNSE